MIQIDFDEGQRMIDTYVCGHDMGDGKVCGGRLVLAWGGSWGIDGHVLFCGTNREHEGFVKMETATQAYRRGESVPMVIEDRIKQRMLTARDVHQAIAILSYKYPAAELDEASGALFLFDCYRLGLDPLLGEAYPVKFKGKGGKKLIQTIISEDGYLSLAARACPKKWMGPPNVKPVTDPVLKDALCSDINAWVWQAEGRTRDMAEGQTSTTYGWFKQSEYKKAQEYRTPAAEQPGNQARVRAIKRWVRENFPEAKAKMAEMTSEWLSRAEAEGVKELVDFIEAEYRIIGPTPTEEGEGTDLLAVCPEHNIAWQEGRYGFYHKKPDNTFCSQSRVFKSLWDGAVKDLGWDTKEANTFLNDNYGASWSKLEPERQVAAIKEAKKRLHEWIAQQPVESKAEVGKDVSEAISELRDKSVEEPSAQTSEDTQKFLLRKEKQDRLIIASQDKAWPPDKFLDWLEANFKVRLVKDLTDERLDEALRLIEEEQEQQRLL